MILLLILILSRSTLYLLFVFLSPFSVPDPSSNINGISCRSTFCDIIEVIGIRPLLFPDDSPFLVVLVSDGLDALVVVVAAVDFLEPRGASLAIGAGHLADNGFA